MAVGRRTGRARALALAVAVLAVVAACSSPAEEPVPAADPAPGPTPAEDQQDEPDEPSPPHEAEPDQEEVTEPPPARPPVALPFRGTWVHLFDNTLKTPAGVAAMVDEVAGAGANAVIVQVARRHDAYYPSEVLAPTPDPGLAAGFDLVADVTERAHDADLAVHAWLSVAPTWHHVYDDLPAPTGWVAREHGRTAPEADRWVTRTVDGGWSEYLDPALPQVREHVAAVVVELVERYPVDGIHLDYVRYESERHGYHPAVLERYRAETGASGTPAPNDADWSAWRRAQTRGLLEHVRAALDATGRDVVLSAPVIAWGAAPGQVGGFHRTRTATETLQDWPGWIRDGVVDAVMPMAYFRAHDAEQAGWFSGWLTYSGELAAEVDGLVVPGVGAWLNDPAAVVDQVHRALDAADGAVVYSYQQPTADESRGVWADLAATAWRASGDGDG